MLCYWSLIKNKNVTIEKLSFLKYSKGKMHLFQTWKVILVRIDGYGTKGVTL